MALTRKKAVAMVKMIPVATWNATKALALFLWEISRNPAVLKDKLAEAQYHLKEVGHCHIHFRDNNELPHLEDDPPIIATNKSATPVNAVVNAISFFYSSVATTGWGASFCGVISRRPRRSSSGC